MTIVLLMGMTILLGATEKPATVIIVAGQSNTDGRVPAEEFDEYIPPLRHCQWRWGSGEAERTQGRFEPFSPTDKSQRRFGKWAYDAFVYQLLEQSLDEDFYVVKWSQGGTAIDTLVQHSTNHNYWCADGQWLSRQKSTAKGGHSLLLSFEELIGQSIDEQLNQLPQGYHIAAFLWHQGESDYQNGQHYKENLQRMVNHVRQYLVRKTGDESYAQLPFIFGTVSERNRMFSREVKQGMRQLAAEDKNCHLIDMGSAPLLSDKLHFTAPSAMQLGTAIYQKMAELGLVGSKSANVVFIGNSITYGALHQQRETTAPPAQCAKWLSGQQDIDTIFFKNCGRSGRTTYHFLPRQADVIPAGDKTYFGDVVAKTRDLVEAHPGLPLVFSIMLGTNDAVERPRNAHTSPEDYARNLTVIIDSLLVLWPDAHVVLNKPIWNSSDYVTKGGSIATETCMRLLAEYYDMFPQVAAHCKAGHVHVGDSKAYDYFATHWQTDLNEEKDARGKSYWLHPNEQGAERLAQFWGQALLPVLRGLYNLHIDGFL